MKVLRQIYRNRFVSWVFKGIRLLEEAIMKSTGGRRSDLRKGCEDIQHISEV